MFSQVCELHNQFMEMELYRFQAVKSNDMILDSFHPTKEQQLMYEYKLTDI